MGIVLICIAAVAVVIGMFAFKQRPKPQGAGSIDFVSAAEVPGQNMILAAITLTLHNTATSPLWIHTLKAQLTTSDGKTFDDDAASVVDLDRYFQAFPALKESAEPPLSPETKLLAGAEQRGTIIVGFKVAREAFDKRKSLIVTIQPYDQVLPVVLKSSRWSNGPLAPPAWPGGTSGAPPANSLFLELFTSLRQRSLLGAAHLRILQVHSFQRIHHGL